MFGSRARAAEAEVTRLKARVRILERTNDRLWQFVDEVGPASAALEATTTALIADLTPTGRSLLQSARRQLSEAVRHLEVDMKFALPWVPWAARRRIWGSLTAADKVVAAWRDAGPEPAVHRRAQAELARTWPTLYAAIRQLVDEAPPPPPPAPTAPPATEVRP